MNKDTYPKESKYRFRRITIITLLSFLLGIMVSIVGFQTFRNSEARAQNAKLEPKIMPVTAKFVINLPSGTRFRVYRVEDPDYKIVCYTVDDSGSFSCTKR